METILIVDDEANYHLPIKTLFEHKGYAAISAYSGNEAWKIMTDRPVDLVLSDMNMPDGNGFELLARIKKNKPEIPVIMLTAFGTVEMAVEAMKLGAVDYLTKPCSNDELLVKVDKALELSRLGRQNNELRAALSQRYSFGSLIGKSKPMQELYSLMEKVAPTKANVLITGESGTGKELVAQALHYNSPRASGPFVAVNCSALAPTLLESELFGHEKGAFTDARQSRAGRFEAANGGSLLLDEVGEMDLGLQVKLLRVLQERRFERVGGNQPIAVDVRLITATNRDLKKQVDAGHFREDLFYRLNVVHLELPPLRERLEDLPLLVEHFLKMYSEGGKAKSLSRQALQAMYEYQWPGNVRELANAVERALVLASGPEINLEDLPKDISQPAAKSQTSPPPRPKPASEQLEPSSGSEGSDAWLTALMSLLSTSISLDESVSALEEALIRRSLERHGGVQSQAAQSLGLKSTVFKYKWDKYQGLKPSSLSEAMAPELPQEMNLAEALERLEEARLLDALEKNGGVQSQAAESLGIKKNLMQYKLKKFDIDPKQFRNPA